MRRSRAGRAGERGRRLPPVLPREDWERVIDAADTDRGQPLLGTRDAAILSLLFFSGLRNFELCALDVRDVARYDPDAGWVLTGVAHVRHGKGDKERWAPVGDEGLHLLEAYLDVRPDLRPDLRPDSGSSRAGEGDQPLFVSRKGGRLTPKAVRDLVKAAGGKAGLGAALHPHALRHANATRQVEHLMETGKGTLYDVADNLGHASLDTLRRYTHLALEGRRARMREL